MVSNFAFIFSFARLRRAHPEVPICFHAISDLPVRRRVPGTAPHTAHSRPRRTQRPCRCRTGPRRLCRRLARPLPSARRSDGLGRGRAAGSQPRPLAVGFSCGARCRSPRASRRVFPFAAAAQNICADSRISTTPPGKPRTAPGPAAPSPVPGLPRDPG